MITLTRGSRSGPLHVISVDSLTKRYRETVAVDGLSFEVRSGSVLGFLGPNGAGKTTTLRILLGLAEPSSGSATIDGHAYRSLPDPMGEVGAVLDSSGFHPGRRGRNHLRVLARAAGLPASRADEALRMVGLEREGRRRVKTYSLGMKQRLNLAAALLGDPQTLVLDEPANGLDPQGIRWLRDFLRSMASEGRTVLVSSHVLAEVAQTVDDVVVIHRGRLVHQGPVHTLTAAGAGVLVRTPRPAELRAALEREGIGAVEIPDGTLVVEGGDAARIGDLAFAAGVPLHELSLRSTSLEEAFLALTSDAPPAALDAPEAP
jgi:ABC-2 type transport system ATP-binding protein